MIAKALGLRGFYRISRVNYFDRAGMTVAGRISRRADLDISLRCKAKLRIYSADGGHIFQGSDITGVS